VSTALRVCVLQPDYAHSGVDYRHYDPPRDLTPWLPGCVVHHLMLDKRTVYRQLRACAGEGYDIYVNLCEGYLDWDVPSIDVIHALEALGLPYTGPTPTLYDPSKPLMKYVAHTAGVTTAPFVEVPPHDVDWSDWRRDVAALPAPLFVKPAHAGDSLGVDEDARVDTTDAAIARAEALRPQYGAMLVEPYLAGREFTVLVLGSTQPGGTPRALRPVEYRFPKGVAFKTYALKTSALHGEANVPVTDGALDARLREAATRVFTAFEGVGYARCDFRLDAQGTLWFLEVNFTCSVLYPPGSEGSADWILHYDGLGPAGFLGHIIAEGRARHAARQRRWARTSRGAAGWGIVAREAIPAGTVVFHGEAASVRIVTRRAAAAWPEPLAITVRRYAVPLSDEVYALWSEHPDDWAPQNHSCAPNTAYDGLDVIACRDIAAGEELTLDYETLLSEHAEPFTCRCGASTCRGTIRGRAGVSVTARERERPTT
jgi:D-alanine-D-alanine ligase